MNHYFATVARGLEPIATQELESLGATSVRPDFTGVHFVGDYSLMYRVNLWARTIFRVLVTVAEFSLVQMPRDFTRRCKIFPGSSTYNHTIP